MGKRGYTPEQIINKLREVELLINQGNPIAVVTRKIGVRSWYPSGCGRYEAVGRSRGHRVPEELAIGFAPELQDSPSSRTQDG
jgi:uncharacterized ParB-like nuclease family protein